MVNKYARMVETMMDDIFGFWIVNARYKSIFVFSDFYLHLMELDVVDNFVPKSYRGP